MRDVNGWGVVYGWKTQSAASHRIQLRQDPSGTGVFIQSTRF